MAGVVAIPVTGLAAPAALAAESSATPTTALYVATTGTDAANNCETAGTPCATITHAVTQAESLTGAAVIHVAHGVYAEQVLVSPPGGSAMTSLTIDGQTTHGGVVIRPTAVTPDVSEGKTGHFFDDNHGIVAAIVGADTFSSGATCAGTCTATTVGASVVFRGLTVDGSALTSIPGGGLDGIALIDTSGAVIANHVEHIQQQSQPGTISVHGIEVKSTNVAATVVVRGNRVNNYAGHVDVALMAAAPGRLSVLVTGNTLTGDPSTNGSGSVAAQFGVAAGGVSHLAITRNRISRFQSPYDVGAIWLDGQAPRAVCDVQGNRLLANDDGVDLRGAARCRVTGNVITAGVAGVEAGATGSGTGASPGAVITRNKISGTVTVATTQIPGGSAITGEPSDGVLIWSGRGAKVTGNAVSGFVADVYVGEDPVFLNNTASWGKTAHAFGRTNGTVVTGNNITHTVAAAKGSKVRSYGLANLFNEVKYRVPATHNWWGCKAGPNKRGRQCVRTAGRVSYRPWSRQPNRV